MSTLSKVSRVSKLATAVAVVAVVGLLVPAAASAVAKKQITIAAVAKSMTYGGPEPALTYAVAGLARGDSLTRKPSCTVPAHRAAGRYTITCAGAAANAAKYTIRYVPASLSVTKATLSVAADYVGKYYADADPSRFTYSTIGFVRGDTFNTDPTCDVDGPHTDVGRYVITCAGGDAGPNYAITYYRQYYDIARSPLLVGPPAQAAYFGSQDPEFTYAVYGLKQGEELDSEPVCGVEGEHAHVGTYPITCTGAEASANYQLQVVDNTFTVLQTGSYVVGERPVLRPGLLGPTGGKLVATLYVYRDGYFQPTDGLSLDFTAGDTTLCRGAVTDSAGQATCTLGANAARLVQSGGYTVTYAGDDDIAGSHHDVANG